MASPPPLRPPQSPDSFLLSFRQPASAGSRRPPTGAIARSRRREATMYSAQAQLADAYIAAGSATEARFIAEDLVAREPWERANIERFRRALVLLGEQDPDGVIAQRLNGESPFMSTDLWVDPPAANEPPTESSELLAAAAEADDPIMQPAWKRPRHEDHHFELSS